MMDLKVLNSALHQLEEERGIPKEKIIEAIEQALAAAYKKEFSQIKIVVEQSMLRPEVEAGEEAPTGTPTENVGESVGKRNPAEDETEEEGEKLIRFNPEQHIMIEDARKIKKD